MQFQKKFKLILIISILELLNIIQCFLINQFWARRKQQVALQSLEIKMESLVSNFFQVVFKFYIKSYVVHLKSQVTASEKRQMQLELLIQQNYTHLRDCYISIDTKIEHFFTIFMKNIIILKSTLKKKLKAMVQFVIELLKKYVNQLVSKTFTVNWREVETIKI